MRIKLCRIEENIEELHTNFIYKDLYCNKSLRIIL